MISVTRKEICDIGRRDTTFRALLDFPSDGFENDQERRLFDRFRLMTALTCGRFFGFDFWARRVLQISHSDTAIRNAVLALGALQLERDCTDLSVAKEQRSLALRSYNNAIAQTNRLLSQGGKDNLEKGLVACVLFTCYENLSGRYDNGQMHLQNGLQILSEADQKPPWSGGTSRRQIPDDIIHVFSRLDLQAMSFSVSSSPYPYVRSFRRSKQPEPVPTSFSSVAEAQHHLFEHIKWIFVVGEILTSSRPPEPIDTEAVLRSKSRSDVELGRWLITFNAFRDKTRQDRAWTPELQYACTHLEIYHTLILICSDPLCSYSEYLYDRYHLQFESIIDRVQSLTAATLSNRCSERDLSKLSFSFEMGLVCPLFVTATRCRDPKLRRRAITLLSSLNRREGVWDSPGAAKVAEKMMQLEEKGLVGVQQADQIAEERRIHSLDAWINIEQREIQLFCALSARPDGSYQTIDELVRF